MKQLLHFIFEIAYAVFKLLIETVGEIAIAATPVRRKVKYDASFGSVSAEFRKKGSGFYVGTEWSTDASALNTHAVCFGGSGSKKTSCIVIPLLLQSQTTSYIIHDPSRELVEKCSADMNSRGYDVMVYDLDHPDNSISFNCISLATSESDIAKIAKVLTKNGIGESQYDYWAQSAEEVIAFFAFVLWRYAEPKHVHLPSVAHFLHVFSAQPEVIDQWMIEHAEEQILTRYRSLVAVPERTRQSTLATAKNIMAIFNDTEVGKLVSRNDIVFSDFRSTKKALFICGSPQQAERCKSISSLLLESCFANMLHTLPSKDQQGVVVCIDEAALLNLSGLPRVLELGRKYSLSVLTLWQDFGQVQYLYGKHHASNILANSKLKIVMPSGISIDMCSMISELCGKFQYTDEDGVTRSKELLSVQEIYQLQKILVLNGNSKPCLIEPRAYFEDARLLRRTQGDRFEYRPAIEPVEPEIISFS